MAGGIDRCASTVVEQVIVDAAMMMHAKVRHVGEGVWLVASTGARRR